jgi:hypothetical protein
MNTETMLGLLRRQPFQPFEVRMSNGDAFQIRHPEMALLLRSNLVLGSSESDDFVFCSLLHVADVQALPMGSDNNGNKTNGKSH